jgi:D12 class N6 adenine-specific DNA methyltransferase
MRALLNITPYPTNTPIPSHKSNGHSKKRNGVTNGVLSVDTRFSLTTEERKKNFLKKLSPVAGKNKYKRYIASPLRYAGGKTLAVGLIVELIPHNIKRLISPFLGGGSLEVAVAKEIDIPVIAFDIFDILMNYWDVQLHNPETPYRILCNGVQREGAKLSPALASELFCYMPLHKIWYGIQMRVVVYSSVFFFM